MAYLCAFVLGLLLVFAGSCPDPAKLQPIALLQNAGFQVICFLLTPVFYLIFSRFFSEKPSFRLGALVVSGFFSLFFLVGTCQNISGSEYFFVPFFGVPGALVQYAAVFFFFYVSVILLDEKAEKLSAPAGKIGDSRSGKSMLLSGILFLLMMWIPWLIAFFPGSLCYDARAQLMQIWGMAPLSNHNPIFDTVIYGIFYNIGAFLGRTDTAGVFAVILFQWLLLGFALGCCAQTAYDLTGRPLVRNALLLFFAVNPIFGSALLVILKDTVHLSVFVLYYCMLLRMALLPEEKGQLLKTGLLCLLALLTRKASLPYVVLAGVMTAWYLRRTAGKKLFLLILAVSGFFLACENLLLPLLRVEAAPSRELYSLFIQNVAYITRNHAQQLTAQELEAIDRLIGLENILTSYDPDLADPLKNIFTGPGSELVKLNLQLACKYPLDAVRGLLTGCWKYYYPFTSGRAYIYAYMAEVDHLGKNIFYAFPMLQNLATWYVHGWANAPVLSLLIGPGLYTWMLLFTAMRVVRKKQWSVLVLMIPLVLLTAGLLLTPVNGENRYAYPVITLAPVFFLLNCRLPQGK